MNDHAVPTCSDYGSPFDFADADLVLRSSDGKNFHVHRIVLGLASTVIRDFPFELSRLPEDTHDGKPVFPLSSESSTAVAHFLQLVYPLPPPTFATLAEAHAVLEFGRKYGAEQVLRRVSDTLLAGPLLATQPHGVYALACGYEMAGPLIERAARNAASRPLMQEKEPAVLGCISGHELFRLLEYRSACADAALQVLDETRLRSPLLQKRTWAWIRCAEMPGYCPESTWFLSPLHGRPGNYGYVKEWWAEYMRNVRAAIKAGTNPVEALSNPTLQGAALVKAGACPTCRKTAASDMKVFVELIKSEVEDRVSAVKCTPVKAGPA
ncbi:hypothetical protein PUNSTDRAFT_134630 [Punctularia strigosozonata HHB-11173 SS5]|uniref:uncharacterized protein n=1 Tax=Punctularia strigosozonata (strain HHB-11173) TaxID=741275 RepID=UPI0004417BA0|nr:uncharacterized protein PUNSTDRAFT_134630 [Punctularia strigosozonata HHB-11173 SS5]EIN08239.1 hypothetical protein PUNSTDRAFT_134630 [Punctularia strigosozonata HHB-11173 SS5]